MTDRDRRTSARAGGRWTERRARGRFHPPLLLPLLIVLAPALWLAFGADRRADSTGFGWLDPGAVEFALPQPWVDPRWEGALARAVSDFGPVSLDDGAGLERLRADLAALPFVAETDAPRVVWPSGAEFPVRLRRPVACLAVGRAFLAVDAEGVVLPGEHRTPPQVDGGFLPVLGPLDGRFDRVRSGERLAELRDLDALSIAESIWSYLDSEHRLRLGRVVIDASGAREVSVERPGAVIALEGGRSIAFGRSPRQQEPGELPLELKWRNVAEALPMIDGGDGVDWYELDARFDRPTFARRGAGEDAR
jgi:hypothetical protein